MAFAYAEEYDLSPWEALLYVIRITAGRVRYCEQVLAGATNDRQLEGRVKDGEPTGVGEDGTLVEERNLSWWVETSERERVLLAKVSKAAIDAGVAQLLVERELRVGNEIADSYLRVWESMREAGVSSDVLELMREKMKEELISMDARESSVVGGVGGVSGASGASGQPAIGS